MFEYYTVSTLHPKFGFDTLIEKIIIIMPILIGIFTVLIFIQAGKRDFDEKKFRTK